jgi:hypothetical protein
MVLRIMSRIDYSILYIDARPYVAMFRLVLPYHSAN